MNFRVFIAVLMDTHCKDRFRLVDHLHSCLHIFCLFTSVSCCYKPFILFSCKLCCYLFLFQTFFHFLSNRQIDILFQKVIQPDFSRITSPVSGIQDYLSLLCLHLIRLGIPA